MTDRELALEHFGILGMHWGRKSGRKVESKDSKTNKDTSKNHAKINKGQKATKKALAKIGKDAQQTDISDQQKKTGRSKLNIALNIVGAILISRLALRLIASGYAATR